MFHENKLVVDCKEKAELSIFSSKQCTIIKNDSQLLHEFLSKISGHLSDAFFTADEIAKMIKNLHLEKTYGHDMINICMLKPCGISIFKALELIFKSCLVNGVFSLEWKKANVVPVHKKNEKESLKIIAQSRCVQSAEKYLSVFYTIIWTFFSIKTTLTPENNPGLSLHVCV